ncbi:hypothetical protein SVIO_066100 [Streptomyces violaceusniger]|uniref:AB hydrolase-1 domain-containing protein n=2 Tax=Streptomyces violaceusniger TaxID=68280 RepID=A0A4D4LBP2_STRVO|nr:hypothetical protein SVIO_066100 [Streptomyces violaceusniger]
MPTAVIVGTADRLTPPEHAHALAAALPHCTGLTELPGLGHMTPLEDPDAVAGVIRGLAEEYGTSGETGLTTSQGPRPTTQEFHPISQESHSREAHLTTVTEAGHAAVEAKEQTA